MSRFTYRISGTVCFPEGIMPGEDNLSNVLSVAKNGRGEPVLRGTAIAGALRSAYQTSLINAEINKDVVNYWFGKAKENTERVSTISSRIVIADMILSAGDTPIETRTHNMVNRHTGVVADNALFSMESLIPGTSGNLLIYIIAHDNNLSVEKFIETLGEIFGSGLTLGGNRNRGIGRMNCDSSLLVHSFPVDTIKGYSEWMNARYADRNNEQVTGGLPLVLNKKDNQFVLNVKIAIPRGEDLVVGYGITNEAQSEPQSIMKADGNEYWCIPGSTFRGVFYGWMSRLAALDFAAHKDKKLRNNATEYYEGKLDKDKYSENLGWGFVNKKTRSEYQKEIEKHNDPINDPIMDLFGSLYKKGRIHFTDAYSEKPVDFKKDIQLRTHVAIDRFTGGANEGMLFVNKVLVGTITFDLRISIDSPTDDELRWLEKTLKAVHLGIISFGSSKGSGRLVVLKCSPSSGGECAKEIARNVNEYAEVKNG